MESDTAAPETRSKWIKTNRGIGVCLAGLIILLLIYLFTQGWVYQTLRDGFRLGFFSVISAVTMLACSVALIFDRHKEAVEDNVAIADRLDFIIPVVAMLVCYVYFRAAWFLDFLIITPLFLIASTYALGIRPLKTSIMAGVIISVVIYILFRLIGIELPTRIIWF